MTKFKAAVFDWAGTMVDFGSFAPMGVFVEAFAAFGITWGIVIWQATTALGWEGGVAAFVLMPVYLAAAVVFIERVAGLWQLFSRRRQQRSTRGVQDQLRAERERVVEAVMAA